MAYRRYFSNPYFQVFELLPNDFTGEELSPYGPTPLTPDAAVAIGRWYFGASPRLTAGNFPCVRIGPFRNHAQALAAARKHFGVDTDDV